MLEATTLEGGRYDVAQRRCNSALGGNNTALGCAAALAAEARALGLGQRGAAAQRGTPLKRDKVAADGGGAVDAVVAEAHGPQVFVQLQQTGGRAGRRESVVG